MYSNEHNELQSHLIYPMSQQNLQNNIDDALTENEKGMHESKKD